MIKLEFVKHTTEDLEFIKELLLLIQVFIPIVITLIPNPNHRFTISLMLILLIAWILRTKLKENIKSRQQAE